MDALAPIEEPIGHEQDSDNNEEMRRLCLFDREEFPVLSAVAPPLVLDPGI